MPNINIGNISDLDINGNNLFKDSESFITEITDDNEQSVVGGFYSGYYHGWNFKNPGRYYKGRWRFKKNRPFPKILSLIGFSLTSLVIFFVLINSRLIINLNAVSIEKNAMLKKEIRQVEYFNSINIKGAYVIEIVCQREQSVEIQAPEDILTLVQTEVRDDILFIFPKNNLPKDEKINIKISAINLRSIDVSGANNIQVNNLKNKQTNINFSGSSNSKISGETEELNVTISSV